MPKRKLIKNKGKEITVMNKVKKSFKMIMIFSIILSMTVDPVLVVRGSVEDSTPIVTPEVPKEEPPKEELPKEEPPKEESAKEELAELSKEDEKDSDKEIADSNEKTEETSKENGGDKSSTKNTSKEVDEQERADELSKAPSPKATPTPIVTQEETLSRTTKVAKKYEIIVNYIDETTKNKIAVSTHQIVMGNTVYQVTSPELLGYELCDDKQKVITGTANGENTTITFDVKYKKKDATYTIVCIWKDSDGVANELHREEKKGIANETVTIVPPAISGYKCITTNKTLMVSPDGKAVKHLYYEAENEVFTIYFSTQGSYVPYISGHVGNPVTMPASPTRTGYDFAGWDQTIPTTMPSKNLYINAKWDAALVTYTVQYYSQNAENLGSYDFETAKTMTGYTGEMTPKAPVAGAGDIGNAHFYDYDREEPVEIRADGTSILRVYYNLGMVDVELRLELDDGSIVTLETYSTYFLDSTKVFPSNIEEVYKGYGGTKISFRGWLNEYSTMLESFPSLLVTTVDPATRKAVYTARFNNSPYYLYAMIDLMQRLDGTYAVVPSERYLAYTPTNVGNTSRIGFRPASYRCGAGYVSGDDSGVIWGQWVDFPESQGLIVPLIPLDSVNNIGNRRWDRLSYPVNYYSGGVIQETIEHLYEEPYQLSEVYVSTLASPGPDYVFDGWYADELYTGTPITEGQQPAIAVNYYAKWKLSGYTVTFDLNGGEGNIPDQSVERSQVATEPQKPVKKGAEFIGWYYKDGLNFYTRYEFDRPVETDTNLIALWKSQQGKVSYTVVHQTIDNEILKTESFEGEVTETVTVAALDKQAKERKGLEFSDAAFKSLELSEEAKDNVITFYYNGSEVYSYVVHHKDEDTQKKVAESEEIISDKWLVEVEAKDIDGYKVTVDSAQITKDEQEYTFYYTKEQDETEQDETDEDETDEKKQYKKKQDGKPSKTSTKAKVTVTAAVRTGDAQNAIMWAVVGLLVMAMIAGMLKSYHKSGEKRKR